MESAMTESRCAARRRPPCMRARLQSLRTKNCTPSRSAASGCWRDPSPST